jgi:hypothetical protein
MLRESRWHWPQYSVVYAFSLLVCWASLAIALALGGRYISVLSWNLFGLEELCRYIVARSSARELARTATGPASLVAAAIAAPVFTVATALIRSPRLRAAGIVIAIVLGIGTLVWIPNPWENM